MLNYKTDKSDPAKEVSTGRHYNDDDTPTAFGFSVDHSKGATRAQVVADVNAHLEANSRTGYANAPGTPWQAVDEEYALEEYSPNGRLLKRTFYADAAQTQKTQESTFAFSGNVLLTETAVQYEADGVTVRATKVYEFNTVISEQGARTITRELVT